MVNCFDIVRPWAECAQNVFTTWNGQRQILKIWDILYNNFSCNFDILISVYQRRGTESSGIETEHSIKEEPERKEISPESREEYRWGYICIDWHKLCGITCYVATYALIDIMNGYHSDRVVMLYVIYHLSTFMAT